MTAEQLKQAQSLLDEYLNGRSEALDETLSLHASTRERLDGMAELYQEIFARTGTPEAGIASLDAALQKVMNEDAKWAEYKEINGLNDRPAQKDHVEMQAYWLNQFEELGKLL